MQDVQDIIGDVVKAEHKKGYFYALMQAFRLHEIKACGNLKSFERRKATAKGNIFEDFCVIYMKTQGYSNVWRLKDLPENIRKMLHLPRGDKGIDIILEAKFQNRIVYAAVQAKYRTETDSALPGKEKGLTWKPLATFYALCQRTGPKEGWAFHLVLSNVKYCKELGVKQPKDMFQGKDFFKTIPKETWLVMANLPPLPAGYKLDAEAPKLDANQVREIRLQKLLKLSTHVSKETYTTPEGLVEKKENGTSSVGSIGDKSPTHSSSPGSSQVVET